MRNLRRSRWSRGIARGLILLFLVPPMLASCLVRPTDAQTTTTIKTITVMDFENLTGQGGPGLGQRAASEVFMQLPQDRFDELKREQVLEQMQALGLRPPLDKAGLLTLGQALTEGLGLEQIITGRVLVAAVQKRAPRQARVKIEVKVLDVASGEFVNGTVAEGRSSPRYDEVLDSDLIDDALGKAASAAVRNLLSQAIPEGTVLLHKGGDVVLNIGQQDGVRPGMNMIVLRREKGRWSRVATVEVVSVTNRDSVARVKEQTRGVMVEDRVRAIYTPAVAARGGILDTVTGRREGRQVGAKTIATLVGGVVLLLLALKMAKTKSPINVPPGNVSARAALTGNNQPAVHVHWTAPSYPPAPDLLGFKIYRSTTRYGNYEVVGEVAGPYERDFFDTTEDRTIQVTDVSGSSTGSTGGTVNTIDVDVTGIVPGVTYYYRVTRIFSEVDTSGTSTTGGTGTVSFRLVESDLSPPTAGSTPLERPRLESPADNETVDPRSITFAWRSVAGGDQYRLQVSDTPTFDPTRTFNSPDNDTRMALPGGPDNQLMSATFNITAKFPATNPQTGQSFVRTLFWRVGVRKASDATAPDGGFIFCDAGRIQTQELPPEPAQ